MAFQSAMHMQEYLSTPTEYSSNELHSGRSPTSEGGDTICSSAAGEAEIQFTATSRDLFSPVPGHPGVFRWAQEWDDLEFSGE